MFNAYVMKHSELLYSYSVSHDASYSAIAMRVYQQPTTNNQQLTTDNQTANQL
jgi:hypothetical protein